MKIKTQSLSLFLLLLILQKNAAAQPFSLDDRVQPTELNLVDYKKEDTMRRGKINITEVTQSKDTSYYFVKGLSMFSPVYFGLTTKAETGNIKINLCKDNWHKPEQTGETGDKGHWQANFKTEGDFGIMVIADNKPADYTMITWMGNEAKDVGMADPFKNADGKTAVAKKGGNFLKDNFMYIIIGLLVVIIGILILKMKKKKS